jgi:dihydroxyacetone kinase
MTKLFNDPAMFTEDMLAGVLDANAPYVVGVPGGVVRTHKTAPVEATADLRPKVGRARPLAERSVGTPNAGATSSAMCVRTVADCFTPTAKGDS